MRAGWTDEEINAPLLARMVADAGAAAVTVHGRTAKQAYSGSSDWDLIGRVAQGVDIPVFGSGDCVEPEQIVARLRSTGVSGVLVGRGVLRNPWILAQASDLAAGRPARIVTPADRGRFLLEYIDLLLTEHVEEADGFRHLAPMEVEEARRQRREPAQGRERWVINKLRALMAWYTKGIDGGARLRTAINMASSIGELHDIIDECFFDQRSSHADSMAALTSATSKS
jgi:tRNA-dihydrouridine synthase